MTPSTPPVLPGIGGPQDLRRLTAPELARLADEIRHLIITTVRRNGGHLAPSLGVEWVVPGPATQDGIHTEPSDPAQAEASFRRRGKLARLLRRATEPLNLHRRQMGELERRIVADPSVQCLAVSEMVAEEFRRYYGRRQGVRTVYNAVDVPDPNDPRRDEWRKAVRQKLNVDESAVVFVTIAKNLELKGVGEAIAAFARWLREDKGGPEARLVVVGRENPELYLSWAQRRNVSGRVVFVPPTDNIFPWYAGADVCILLSWYDPCSRVVLEATRWGIPSITTVYNGAAEVLSGGGGIVVASPKDADGVVRAMQELSDREARRRRSDACRRVADKLTVARHVDELLEAYAACSRARKDR